MIGIWVTILVGMEKENGDVIFAGLYQVSMFPYISRLWFVGQGSTTVFHLKWHIVTNFTSKNCTSSNSDIALGHLVIQYYLINYLALIILLLFNSVYL